MDALTAKTVKRAARAAAKNNRPAYVVATYFGPRIDWQPAAFGAVCIKVDPSGTVEMVAVSREP